MNRQALLRCADLADTAKLYATLTASHANLKPEKAREYGQMVEDALKLALMALEEARNPQPLELAA